MSRAPFGHIGIEPKRVTGDAFWAGAPRDGFSKLCRAKFGDFRALDDVTDREVQTLIERGHVLQAMAPTKAAATASQKSGINRSRSVLRSNKGIRREGFGVNATRSK